MSSRIPEHPRELHWLRISDRIMFKILILTHKAFHGVALVYLCELITKYEQASVIKKLDRVQRSSARVVCRLHKYQRISMTEVLHELHWLPVASRIKYKLLIVTFKALRTGTPGYLSNLLVKQKITKRTRSQSIDAPDRLIVPLYSGERSAGTSYSVAAPKLWNSLPANIRSSRSLDTFKKHLKTHYFKEHFYGI